MISLKTILALLLVILVCMSPYTRYAVTLRIFSEVLEMNLGILQNHYKNVWLQRQTQKKQKE